MMMDVEGERVGPQRPEILQPWLAIVFRGSAPLRPHPMTRRVGWEQGWVSAV